MIPLLGHDDLCLHITLYSLFWGVPPCGEFLNLCSSDHSPCSSQSTHCYRLEGEFIFPLLQFCRPSDRSVFEIGVVFGADCHQCLVHSAYLSGVELNQATIVTPGIVLIYLVWNLFSSMAIP